MSLCVFRGDCMFNSNKLSLEAHPPVLVHAFGANKFRFGKQLEALSREGMEPVLTSLLGSVDKNRFYGNMLRVRISR